MSHNNAWKLAVEAGIESALQVDTLALLKYSFLTDFNYSLQKMFKIYRQEEDNTLLISNHILERGNLLHHLYE